MEFRKFSDNARRLLRLGLGGAIASALLLLGMPEASAQVSTGGFVRTNSGIGVHVRARPGLTTIIGGYEDGEFVRLTTRRQFADGFTWAELADRSGWVATQYLVLDGSNIGGPGGGNILIPNGSTTGGPYVVAVPGDSFTRLDGVRRYAPIARVEQSSQGSFIHAGGFGNRSDAEALATLLRTAGYDARVTYRRFY